MKCHGHGIRSRIFLVNILVPIKTKKSIHSQVNDSKETRLMLNLFEKNQEKDVSTILKIKNWVRKTFELTEYETVLITELQCHEKGYPPIETVMVVLREKMKKEQYKLHKPMNHISLEDITNLSTRQQI